MTPYKLFIFRDGNDAPHVISISCSDDATAGKVAAGIAREADMVEVWQDSRLVDVSCRTRPGAPSTGLPLRAVRPSHGV